jgi:hypothetical protein
MVYSTAMSVAQNSTSLVEMMIKDCRIRKDIVRSGDGHFAVLYRYLHGKVRKTMKTSVMRVASSLGCDSNQMPPEWKSEILANNHLDALFHVFIYFISLHFSSITVLIIRSCFAVTSRLASQAVYYTD